MTEEIPLTEAIERFLEDHSMSAVTFGRKAMNDPHFVRDISAEKPRRLFRETEQKVRDFIRDYRPEARAA